VKNLSCKQQSLSRKHQPLSCKSPRLIRFGLWFERKERPSQFRSPVNRLRATSQMLQHRRKSHMSRSPCTRQYLSLLFFIPRSKRPSIRARRLHGGLQQHPSRRTCAANLSTQPLMRMMLTNVLQNRWAAVVSQPWR
jgi:hypothetical protein